MNTVELRTTHDSPTDANEANRDSVQPDLGKTGIQFEHAYNEPIEPTVIDSTTQQQTTQDCCDGGACNTCPVLKHDIDIFGDLGELDSSLREKIQTNQEKLSTWDAEKPVRIKTDNGIFTGFMMNGRLQGNYFTSYVPLPPSHPQSIDHRNTPSKQTEHTLPPHNSPPQTDTPDIHQTNQQQVRNPDPEHYPVHTDHSPTILPPIPERQTVPIQTELPKETYNSPKPTDVENSSLPETFTNIRVTSVNAEHTKRVDAPIDHDRAITYGQPDRQDFSPLSPLPDSSDQIYTKTPDIQPYSIPESDMLILDTVAVETVQQQDSSDYSATVDSAVPATAPTRTEPLPVVPSRTSMVDQPKNGGIDSVQRTHTPVTTVESGGIDIVSDVLFFQRPDIPTPTDTVLPNHIFVNEKAEHISGEAVELSPLLNEEPEYGSMEPIAHESNTMTHLSTSIHFESETTDIPQIPEFIPLSRADQSHDMSHVAQSIPLELNTDGTVPTTIDTPSETDQPFIELKRMLETHQEAEEKIFAFATALSTPNTIRVPTHITNETPDTVRKQLDTVSNPETVQPVELLHYVEIPHTDIQIVRQFIIASSGNVHLDDPNNSMEQQSNQNIEAYEIHDGSESHIVYLVYVANQVTLTGSTEAITLVRKRVQKYLHYQRKTDGETEPTPEEDQPDPAIQSTQRVNDSVDVFCWFMYLCYLRVLLFYPVNPAFQMAY